MANVVKTAYSKDRAKPIRHLALFNYKDSLPADTKNEIVESFTKLSNRMGFIRQAEWGSELLLLGLNKGLDDAFLLTFDHPGDYRHYLRNPLTRYFYDKEVYPNTQAVLTIDYVANVEE